MEETEVMTTELEAAIDASWDDTAPVVEETPAESEEAPAEAAPAEPAETPAEPVAEPVQEAELFTLKNRDETRQVGKDELIAMAQKGWDYDTVRSERDQLRAYRDETESAMSIVKAFAERSGLSVQEYLDYCRKQELMSSGINEATADAQVALERKQAVLDSQLQKQKEEQDAKAREQAEADKKAEARRADMQQFMSIYPEVKAESIPKEVWTQVHSGVPLATAYTMYQNRTLQAELQAERQNKAAREKSTGSMTTAGDKSVDVYDEGWYD